MSSNNTIPLSRTAVACAVASLVVATGIGVAHATPEAQRTLMGQLPSGFTAANCDDRPIDGQEIAGVTCDAPDNGSPRANFFLYANASGLDSDYQDFVASRTRVDCPGEEDKNSWNYSDTPDVTAGSIACVINSRNEQILVWTENAELMLSIAIGGSHEQLIDWWTRTDL